MSSNFITTNTHTHTHHYVMQYGTLHTQAVRDSVVNQPSRSTSLLYLSRFFLVSTFYKVNLYTALSTCNQVTFSCKYLLSTSLLCSQPCRYRSRNVHVILYMSVLDAGYAASVIAVFSVAVSSINHIISWISMFNRTGCYNDSRQCHAKDEILKLRGYIGLDV